ncbi:MULTISPECIES: hypothetical protein [Thermomonospora]|uniref:Uncharacterized protein n=1 Tax=Thermomonospora curvata (strain ATCC 19995 / DSM 43183 / JCM 3096 / KCTC 9072 / NBRC 15933 / NCIMB 10081 / Henssen B9) TaxID=471852 RepID=D1AB98_THECD|nr:MULTISPECIES: hypothetical protein [Thermomonospora]ACY97134.1 hypothetical protein Tcur_1558 [Thermomonospora curvata DSM 43183]PKK14997.1 MAG: hypothetical protein BUE48_007575 [Thermomonospora sp. CIF 1]
MRRLIIALLVLPSTFGLSLWTGFGPFDDWVHNCQVRQQYLDRLEAMRVEVNKLRVEGRSEKEIAEIMVPRHNEAKALVRTKMKAKEVAKLEERNRARYGDPMGPTVEWMHAQHGGNWHEVVEATLDSNRLYDLSCLPWFDL